MTTLQADVLVIGGGATGAGVAWDCALRGYDTILVDRRDLAEGTSGRFHGLLHSGGRYVVKDPDAAVECVHENAIVRRVAADTVEDTGGLFVTTPDDDPAYGDRFAEGCRATGLPTEEISPAAALKREPLLNPGIKRAFTVPDGSIDVWKLVWALANGAAAHGARVLTYAEVTGLRDDGVEAIDGLTGAAFTVRARHTILAAGVWTSALTGAVTLRPSRGSHLLVRAERLGDPRAMLSVKVPGERSRWVFAIPRGDGLVTLGLTDVPAPGAPVDEPQPDAAEEAELLDRISAALDVPLTAADVVGRYAGLRPLAVVDGATGGATADLSRRHAIVTDSDSGALAIVGGKLTTYRRMAQDAVDQVTDRPCRTARLSLVGAASPAALASVAAPERLVRRYGTEAPAVVALADGRPELLEPVGEGVPVCGAELLWAVRHELALTVDDLVDRRVRAGLVPSWRAAAVPAASELALAPANVNGAG